MANKDMKKTAFVTPIVPNEFNVMSFDLSNAPTTYEKVMGTVLCRFQREDLSVLPRQYRVFFFHYVFIERSLLESCVPVSPSAGHKPCQKKYHFA